MLNFQWQAGRYLLEETGGRVNTAWIFVYDFLPAPTKTQFNTKEICCPTFEFSVLYCTRFELWHVLILSAFVVRGSHVLICRRITMFCMVISKWKCSPNFNSCVFTILHAMSSTMRVLVVGGCHRVGGRGRHRPQWETHD